VLATRLAAVLDSIDEVPLPADEALPALPAPNGIDEAAE
jgi:hypothetical protein